MEQIKHKIRETRGTCHTRGVKKYTEARKLVEYVTCQTRQQVRHEAQGT